MSNDLEEMLTDSRMGLVGLLVSAAERGEIEDKDYAAMDNEGVLNEFERHLLPKLNLAAREKE